eukprot:2362319-Pleurochrysis_carterae.AAC.4
MLASSKDPRHSWDNLAWRIQNHETGWHMSISTTKPAMLTDHYIMKPVIADRWAIVAVQAGRFNRRRRCAEAP